LLHWALHSLEGNRKGEVKSGFVDDIKDIFKRNNMLLYNELILVESIGTLPQRVGRFMEHRKIGKCHQNVLVFFKGDPKHIKTIYPKLDYIDSEDNIEDYELKKKL
jgi:hypothetical protein